MKMMKIMSKMREEKEGPNDDVYCREFWLGHYFQGMGRCMAAIFSYTARMLLMIVFLLRFLFFFS